MTDTATRRTTRAERMTHPLAVGAVKMLAEAAGGCVRPVQLRKTNLDTGQTEQVLVPCGSPMEATCPACAERCKSLRAEQCADGWHRDTEPVAPAAKPDDWQTWLLEQRAELQRARDQDAAAGVDTAELDELITELDVEIRRSGLRGSADPAAKKPARRTRSTRRRQDAPGLPRRKIDPRTVGKVYTAPDGKTYRPSMFLTLTLDTYGKVRDDGTPVHPDRYDYRRAARDAMHFPALADRFIKNLRRYVGYDAQYFGAIEPQRRLAPHLHLALRGTVPRADLRQIIAGTYFQVWWPTDDVKFDGERLPVWHDETGYLDPDTGEVLPTWDQALDAIGPQDEPRHVVWFGPMYDAQGVLPGTKDAGRCIRYLTKYLTKHLSGCHTADTDAQRDHAARLAEALRYEPCSPRCANWLRYGIQPQGAKKGQRPGACRGKAHRPDNLGYAGRRVLVSRKWSGKTLADHRADRKAWLLAMLGLPEPEDTGRYRWEQVGPSDTDFMPYGRRMLHVLADRAHWKASLAEARRRADEATGNLSATGTEAA